MIPVKGFNGKPAPAISHYITMHLLIDQRKILCIPFLILDLGQHDVILGKHWLAAFDVKPDCRRRKLSWPRKYPPTEPGLLTDVPIPVEAIQKKPVQLDAQRDADRRDRLIEANDKRRQDGLNSVISTVSASAKVVPTSSEVTKRGSPTPKLAGAEKSEVAPEVAHESAEEKPETPLNLPGATSPDIRSPKAYKPRYAGKSSFLIDQRESLRSIEVELKNDAVLSLAAPPPRRLPSTSAEMARTILDISLISGSAFHFNCQSAKNEFFGTSLYEIDRRIAELEEGDDEDSEEQEQLRDFAIAAATLVLVDADGEKDEIEAIGNLPKVPEPHQDWIHVFSKRASDKLPPHRSIDHKIVLDKGKSADGLSYSPLYKMSLDELKVAKQYIEENLDKGFIEPSQAPFAAPILFVKKPDGSLRFCIDYRKLNLLTRKDQYPLPLIDETLARLASAKIYTKLDIRQAFHRIRIDPDSEELTTFRTRYGAYKCKVLPFGLTNGPATYQRYMNDVLFDYLDDFCTAYLDDILIYSDNILEHNEHVNKVLARLDAAGLQADLKKCEFNVTSTKYLGFIVSTDGIRVDPAKVEVVKNWAPPSSVRGIQSFLGFCNFYRRFIRDFGRIARPLTHLTKKDVDFRFDAKCHEAFEILRQALISAPVLAHYDPQLQCKLETDASDGVLGAVLSQQHGKDWKPVAYFSKSMAPAELNYTIHDKEMLSIVKSLKEWRAELQASPFEVPVVTDHKALEVFMTTKSLNGRQARWAEFLADFRILITFRSGKENIPADILTRREEDLDIQNAAKRAQRVQVLLREDQVDPAIWRQATAANAAAVPITTPSTDDGVSIQVLEKIAIELAPLNSPTSAIAHVLEANRSSKTLASVRAQANGPPEGRNRMSLENGLLLFRDRLVVPDDGPLRASLIKEVHDSVASAHPSQRKTYALLRPLYYWPRMRDTIDQYVNNCHACRRAKVPRTKKPGLLHPLPIPDRPWQHITTDFCEFPTDKHGYNNVLVFIDRLSKQAISIPCRKEVSAVDLARLYVYHVYRYFGPPETIVSDRGPQYMSEFWNELNAILGTKVKLSTAYHPQTDGQTEIYNQYLVQRLRPFVTYFQDNWSELLPMMDYAQLTLPHDSLGGMTPFEVRFAREPKVVWDWHPNRPDSKHDFNTDAAQDYARALYAAYDQARSAMEKSQRKMERSASSHKREVNFEVNDKVYLDMRPYRSDRPSRKLSNPFGGPYKIIAKEGHSFRLDLPPSMKVHPVFHPDRLYLDPQNPLEGQELVPGEEVNVTGDQEYEVQEILSSRRRYRKLSYMVRWVGYDIDVNWYPASDLKYSPHKLRDFHHAYPKMPGPPRRLLEWIKAWEDGVDNYDDLDDDTEMSQSLRASFFGRGG